MRVTIVSRIYSPEPSAASYFLNSVAHRLVAAGLEVRVLTTTAPKGATVTLTPRISVRRAPVLRDRSGYVRGYIPYLSFDIPLAFRLLFSRRADLYFVEPPPTTGSVVRVVAALLRRPYIYDAADVWSDAARLATGSRLVLAVLRRIELFALRGAAHIVTISEEVVGRLRELDVRTPVTVVGFGADTSIFCYRSTEPAASQYFVYGGTFSEWQGADIFIDAFARFSREHPGYRLLFIGNGSERDTLEQRARALDLAGVEFWEPIPGTELAEILASATASLASLKPGVGYDYAFASKVYASLAVGCPTIFAGPGPTVDFLRSAESVQPSGAVVAYDVAEVATALASFADAPLTAEQRRALSGWAIQNHSLEAVGDRVANLVTEVLRRTR